MVFYFGTELCIIYYVFILNSYIFDFFFFVFYLISITPIAKTICSPYKTAWLSYATVVLSNLCDQEMIAFNTKSVNRNIYHVESTYKYLRNL